MFKYHARKKKKKSSSLNKQTKDVYLWTVFNDKSNLDSEVNSIAYIQMI